MSTVQVRLADWQALGDPPVLRDKNVPPCLTFNTCSGAQTLVLSLPSTLFTQPVPQSTDSLSHCSGGRKSQIQIPGELFSFGDSKRVHSLTSSTSSDCPHPCLPRPWFGTSSIFKASHAASSRLSLSLTLTPRLVSPKALHLKGPHQPHPGPYPIRKSLLPGG